MVTSYTATFGHERPHRQRWRSLPSVPYQFLPARIQFWGAFRTPGFPELIVPFLYHHPATSAEAGDDVKGIKTHFFGLPLHPLFGFRAGHRFAPANRAASSTVIPASLPF